MGMSVPQMHPPTIRRVERPAAAPTGTPRDATANVARPLSAAVLAERPRQETNARPVIHVTIDRIEVRSQAAAKQASPARRRTSEPAVSLTDYLRRPRPSGGAV
jgi:hypothetical protein